MKVYKATIMADRYPMDFRVTASDWPTADANSDDYIAADIDGSGFYQHGENGKRGRHLGKKVPFTSLSTDLRMKLARE